MHTQLPTRIIACRCEKERRIFAYSRVRLHTQALFLLSSELAGIVIEYAGNAAAEYAISQMIRENSSWPVRFYVGASFFLFPYAIEANGQHHRKKKEGWIGARWYHTSQECRAIDIKTFPNHSNVRRVVRESRCVIVLFRAGEDHQSRTRKLINAPRNFMDDMLLASWSPSLHEIRLALAD